MTYIHFNNLFGRILELNKTTVIASKCAGSFVKNNCIFSAFAR